MKRSLVFLFLAVVALALPTQAQWVVAPNTVPPRGTSPAAWACYSTCVLPSYIVADDFDQDGWLDLAVSCAATGNIWAYRNRTAGNPGGVFQPGALVAAGSLPGATGLVTGHIIGSGPAPMYSNMYDGYPEVAVLSPNAVPNLINAIPVQAVNWVPAPPVPLPPLAGGTPPGIIHLAGGNFNNDNALDLALITPAGLFVYSSVRGPNNYAPAVAGGLLSLPLAVPGGPAVFVASSDFNQDGWDDVAVVSWNAATGPSLSLYYNDGAGNLAGPTPGPAITNWLVPTGMDVGDFDANGYPDLVVVGNRGVPPQGFAEVFLNTVNPVGFASLSPPGAMQTWGFAARFVEVLDADGNGRDDFAVANWESNTVTIFLSNAAINLVADPRRAIIRAQYCLPADSMLSIGFMLFKLELQCGHYPVGLAAGDFDHNGKMDLAVALQSADKELCAQNPSCIEIDFDIACGFTSQQTPHGSLPGVSGERQQCPECKGEPCKENVPPKAEIQTESGTKNQ